MLKSPSGERFKPCIIHFCQSTSTQPVDTGVGAKEQAWQDYYQGCSGLGNAEWRSQKSQELGREFTDEDVYNNFEAQWRGVFESEWGKTGNRPRGCG